MSTSLDTVVFFGFLTLFHLWGGAAIGAGLRSHRRLPVVWGLLVGGAPLYFGIERLMKLGSWAALLWQVVALASVAALVATRWPRLRAFFAQAGMNSIMVGTFIMTAGAIAGAWLFRLGSETASLIAGGLAFLLGAMWFGAGIRQLRGR